MAKKNKSCYRCGCKIKGKGETAKNPKNRGYYFGTYCPRCISSIAKESNKSKHCHA